MRKIAVILWLSVAAATGLAQTNNPGNFLDLQNNGLPASKVIGLTNVGVTVTNFVFVTNIYTVNFTNTTLLTNSTLVLQTNVTLLTNSTTVLQTNVTLLTNSTLVLVTNTVNNTNNFTFNVTNTVLQTNAVTVNSTNVSLVTNSTFVWTTNINYVTNFYTVNFTNTTLQTNVVNGGVATSGWPTQWAWSSITNQPALGTASASNSAAFDLAGVGATAALNATNTASIVRSNSTLFVLRPATAFSGFITNRVGMTNTLGVSGGVITNKTSP